MRMRTVALAAALVALAAAARGNERWPGGGETHHDAEIVDDAGAFARPRRGRHDPVPNFGVIWEKKLTRSGQPRSPEGWTWLRRWAAGHEPGSHRLATGKAAEPVVGMPPASTVR